MWILNPYILSVDSQLCEESRLNCKPVYIYTIYQLLQHMEICYHNSNKNECTTGLGCVECLCSSCIWSFMSIHIISQATDEVPMMQQQSVQQQKTAPGVGFQPWVQTHTSHPSHTLPLPFALFQPLHWPPASWTHTHTPCHLFVLLVCFGQGVSVQFFFVFDQPRSFFCRKLLEWLFMAHRSPFPPPVVD